MKVPGNESGGHAGFLDVVPDFCATILEALVRGWAMMCNHPEMRPGKPEVEVTELLRNGMRMAVNQSTGHHPRMIVLPGTESLSQPTISRPDGPTDNPICFPDIFEACLDPDPHAIIECKRIAGSDRDLCRLYVVEGIDRFVSGKYSRRHTIAFMCGYLQSDDVELAVDGVNRYLSKKGRVTERLGLSTIVPDPWARSSRHPRASNQHAIDIHHAFLAFTASIRNP